MQEVKKDLMRCLVLASGELLENRSIEYLYRENFPHFVDYICSKKNDEKLLKLKDYSLDSGLNKKVIYRAALMYGNEPDVASVLEELDETILNREPVAEDPDDKWITQFVDGTLTAEEYITYAAFEVINGETSLETAYGIAAGLELNQLNVLILLNLIEIILHNAGNEYKGIMRNKIIDAFNGIMPGDEINEKLSRFIEIYAKKGLINLF